MSKDKQKLIDQFHKNSLELVKIQLTEWQDQLYADIRIWILEDAAKPESAIATKKGIRISVDLLPKLIEALKKAEGALSE